MPRVAGLTTDQKIKDMQQLLDKRISDKTDDIQWRLMKAKITQQQVAEVAGITQSSVANQFRKGELSTRVTEAAELLLAR